MNLTKEICFLFTRYDGTDVVISGDFTPGRPATMHASNGDPGDPAEPAEFNLKEVRLTSIGTPIVKDFAYINEHEGEAIYYAAIDAYEDECTLEEEYAESENDRLDSEYASSHPYEYNGVSPDDF